MDENKYITLQRYTFKAGERLKSKKEISRLFSNGKSFISEPFKVIWDYSEIEINYPAQIAISVPKRNFKKAVDRNFIKRQTREGYRKNKYILYRYLTHKNLNVSLIIIYLSRKKLETLEIEKSIIKLIDLLINKINTK